MEENRNYMVIGIGVFDGENEVETKIWSGHSRGSGESFMLNMAVQHPEADFRLALVIGKAVPVPPTNPQYRMEVV